MFLAMYKLRYSNSKKSSFSKLAYSKQNATRYWLEHKINLLDLTKMLSCAKFSDRFTIAELISIAERKVSHWQKHPNFNLQKALTVFNAVKYSTVKT